jgi:hypothetical protein
MKVLESRPGSAEECKKLIEKRGGHRFDPQSGKKFEEMYFEETKRRKTEKIVGVTQI